MTKDHWLVTHIENGTPKHEQITSPKALALLLDRLSKDRRSFVVTWVGEAAVDIGKGVA